MWAFHRHLAGRCCWSAEEKFTEGLHESWIAVTREDRDKSFVVFPEKHRGEYEELVDVWRGASQICVFFTFLLSILSSASIASS